jgi:hypothetical protein
MERIDLSPELPPISADLARIAKRSPANRGFVQPRIFQGNGGLIGNRTGELDLRQREVPLLGDLGEHQGAQFLPTDQRKHQQALRIGLQEFTQRLQIRFGGDVFCAEYAQRIPEAGEQGSREEALPACRGEDRQRARHAP